jgi:hypothetical protein
MSEPGHAAETGGADGRRFAGAQIPAGRYGDDDGSTPPELAQALAHWRHSGDPAGVVVALRSARVLVALMSQLDSADPTGSEKDSHMAAATLIRPQDGRKALLSFTSVAALAAWHPTARPLPVTGIDAARAAISDGAAALLLDGECGVSGPYLWALAEDRDLVPADQDVQVRGVIETEVARVLGAAGLPTRCQVAASNPPGGVVVLLDAAVVGQRAAVDALAQALSEHAVLRRRLLGPLSIGVAP